MNSIIRELWDGSLVPWERCGAGDPEVRELSALMMRNRELLEGDLRPQQQEVLKNYMENVEEYLLHMTELAFCEGFSLASRLLVEALGRERERYRPNAQKREVPGGGSPRPTLGLK